MSSIAIRLFHRVAIGALALVLLAGCGSLPFLSQPTPTPSPSATPLPTDTPLPSPTFTPEPTATFTLAPSPTLAPTVAQPTLPAVEPTSAATVDPAQAIRVYYINKEETGQFGCGEELWFLTTKQAKSSVVENDVRFALNTILTYHGETIGQLYNPGYAASIGVNSVEFNSSGTIVVNLTGTWTPTKDRCDGRRFIDQMRQTIKQFDGVSGIVIYLNGTPISDALSRK